MLFGSGRLLPLSLSCVPLYLSSVTTAASSKASPALRSLSLTCCGRASSCPLCLLLPKKLSWSCGSV